MIGSKQESPVHSRISTILRETQRSLSMYEPEISWTKILTLPGESKGNFGGCNAISSYADYIGREVKKINSNNPGINKITIVTARRLLAS